jgi:hypothetical protein
MLYPSNQDDSQFQNIKPREFNRLIDDECAMQQRQGDNTKKLKFVTTNHIDLLEGKDKLNFFGMTTKDKLFVPSEQVDQYSSLLNGEAGSSMTNCRVRHGFGQLPLPTAPSKYQLAHGDITIEDSLRGAIEVNKQSCNPRDISFHDRHFYIFEGIEKPDATKSIETGAFGNRGGQSTRFDNRIKRKV